MPPWIGPGRTMPDRDDEVVEVSRLEPRRERHLRARLDLEHADRVGPRQHLVDRRVLRRDRRERVRVGPLAGDGLGRVGERRRAAGRWRASSASVRESAVSIPRPSRSTLSRPSSARSSLSHWTIVRPGMAAGSMGTVSQSGRRVMTNPPTWMERWRGKPTRSRASSSVSRTRSESTPSAAASAGGRPPRGRRTCRAASRAGPPARARARAPSRRRAAPTCPGR